MGVKIPFEQKSDAASSALYGNDVGIVNDYFFVSECVVVTVYKTPGMNHMCCLVMIQRADN